MLFPIVQVKKIFRKLYMVNTYFFHRTAFKGAMYEKQTYFKSSRNQFRHFEKVFNKEDAYKKIYSKYFKKYYSGKPTKIYASIRKKTMYASNMKIEPPKLA